MDTQFRQLMLGQQERSGASPVPQADPCGKAVKPASLHLSRKPFIPRAKKLFEICILFLAAA
jgi:hypothetical protein